MPAVGSFVRWSLALRETLLSLITKFHLNYLGMFYTPTFIYYRYFKADNSLMTFFIYLHYYFALLTYTVFLKMAITENLSPQSKFLRNCFSRLSVKKI